MSDKKENFFEKDGKPQTIADAAKTAAKFLEDAANQKNGTHQDFNQALDEITNQMKKESTKLAASEKFRANSGEQDFDRQFAQLVDEQIQLDHLHAAVAAKYFQSKALNSLPSDPFRAQLDKDLENHKSDLEKDYKEHTVLGLFGNRKGIDEKRENKDAAHEEETNMLLKIQDGILNSDKLPSLSHGKGYLTHGDVKKCAKEHPNDPEWQYIAKHFNQMAKYTSTGLDYNGNETGQDRLTVDSLKQYTARQATHIRNHQNANQAALEQDRKENGLSESFKTNAKNLDNLRLVAETDIVVEKARQTEQTQAIKTDTIIINQQREQIIADNEKIARLESDLAKTRNDLATAKEPEFRRKALGDILDDADKGRKGVVKIDGDDKLPDSKLSDPDKIARYIVENLEGKSPKDPDFEETVKKRRAMFLDLNNVPDRNDAAANALEKGKGDGIDANESDPDFAKRQDAARWKARKEWFVVGNEVQIWSPDWGEPAALKSQIDQQAAKNKEAFLAEWDRQHGYSAPLADSRPKNTIDRSVKNHVKVNYANGTSIDAEYRGNELWKIDYYYYNKQCFATDTKDSAGWHRTNKTRNGGNVTEIQVSDQDFKLVPERILDNGNIESVPRPQPSPAAPEPSVRKVSA